MAGSGRISLGWTRIPSPYRLIDATGLVVEAATVYVRELLACGKAQATVRSYGMDLRWWRLLHSVEVYWDRVTRVEARYFSGHPALSAGRGGTRQT